jgi:citrate synthase
MNQLARCVLFTYSFDENPEDLDIRNILRQIIELIARFPTMVAYGYQAKNISTIKKAYYSRTPTR